MIDEDAASFAERYARLRDEIAAEPGRALSPGEHLDDPHVQRRLERERGVSRADLEAWGSILDHHQPWGYAGPVADPPPAWLDRSDAVLTVLGGLLAKLRGADGGTSGGANHPS